MCGQKAVRRVTRSNFVVLEHYYSCMYIIIVDGRIIMKLI